MSLDTALGCAELGWYVFPLRARGKEPTVRWAEWATTDRAKITAEFSGRDLNYGIACGPSGLVMIDEDELGALVNFATERGEAIPPVLTVRTARGRHYYFAAPDDANVGNTEGALKVRKINVRGSGGYVVGPGSVHSFGVVYAVENIVPARAVPVLVAHALLERPSLNGASPYDPPPLLVGEYDELPETIKHHERHDTLMRWWHAMSRLIFRRTMHRLSGLTRWRCGSAAGLTSRARCRAGRFVC